MRKRERGKERKGTREQEKANSMLNCAFVAHLLRLGYAASVSLAGWRTVITANQYVRARKPICVGRFRNQRR